MHPFDKFAEKYAEHRSRKGRGAFIDILISLIPVIIPLIQGCFNATPRAVRRRLFSRARLAAEIRKMQPDLTYAEAFEAADDCFDVADAASDQEVQEFIQCCK